MKKMLLVLLSPLLFTGCAALSQMAEEQRQAWIQENCNTNAAYNQGMTDGLTPGNMPQKSFARICPNNNAIIDQAYIQGFTKGIKGRPQEVVVNNIESKQ